MRNDGIKAATFYAAAEGRNCIDEKSEKKRAVTVIRRVFEPDQF